VTPDEAQAMRDLVHRRITREDFVRRSGLDGDAMTQRLAAATRAEDAAELQYAMLLVSASGGYAAEHAPALTELVVATWHTRHEDVASALQDARDPRSVDDLARAARMKHAHFAHDDSHAFARKCVWALADIGTPEACRRIEELAIGDDAEVASYAQRRLDRWDAELGRKGRAR
jgi:hypothetical protein